MRPLSSPNGITPPATLNDGPVTPSVGETMTQISIREKSKSPPVYSSGSSGNLPKFPLELTLCHVKDDEMCRGCNKRLSLVTIQVLLTTFSILERFLPLSTITTSILRPDYVEHASSFISQAKIAHHGNDRVAGTFKLLPLVIELVHFCKLVPIQPVDRLNNCILNLLLVSLGNHVISLLIINSASHLVRIIFQGNLGIDPLLVLLVLSFVLLSLYCHFINLFCGQPSLDIGNSDTVLLTSGRLLCRDIQDAIDINIKADTYFWDMPWCRWNSTEIKFSQEVVILGSCSFTLVHRKTDNSLVVIPRGETLLHLGRNWCVPWNYKTHFTSVGIHSQR
ncbi:hypothetical protein RJ640_009302 [Escallonia rubra]|uniref:Uncharacterized protein n=1 Tax=Escallonia rubra TaxID=112253 RepID=A0AA88R7Y4_9ASTE|nr:hypothetical protein RJ640_009302 [Escallonia rubra]